MNGWVWSISGMILRGENRSTQKKTYPRATLPATSPTWTGQGLNPDLQSDRPMTNTLNYDTTTWQYWLCGMYEVEEKCIPVLVGKPQWKRPLERVKHRRGLYFTENSHMTQLGYEFLFNISNVENVLCKISIWLTSIMRMNHFMIKKWIWNRRRWHGLHSPDLGWTSGRPCEYRNEPVCSIKGREFSWLATSSSRSLFHGFELASIGNQNFDFVKLQNINQRYIDNFEGSI